VKGRSRNGKSRCEVRGRVGGGGRIEEKKLDEEGE